MLSHYLGLMAHTIPRLKHVLLNAQWMKTVILRELFLVKLETMQMRFSHKLTGLLLFLILYCSAGYLVWLILIKWHSLLRFIFH